MKKKLWTTVAFTLGSAALVSSTSLRAKTGFNTSSVFASSLTTYQPRTDYAVTASHISPRA